MAYWEKYYVEYCDPDGREFRLSIHEWGTAYIELIRRGHFNDVAPSEIGIYLEGADLSAMQVGDTMEISNSAYNNGTYTITGFLFSAPPDSPYVRIQLSPQVPVQLHEDGVHIAITTQPQAPKELEAAPIPFMPARETSSELKQGGIFPTRATITLASSPTFSLEELYTADERKYYVQHEPTDGTDEGKWYGHIIPNGFSEQMDDNVHYMVLTASDDLPTLRGILFEESPGVNYGSENSIIYGEFEQTFLWVAKEALKKTGLLLPIRTMVDVKPATFDAAETYSLDINYYVPNILSLMDFSKTLAGNISVGSRVTIISGEKAGEVIEVDSFTVTPAITYDLIEITPVEPLVLPSATYSGEVTVSGPPNPAAYPDPLAVTVHDLRVYIRDKDIEGKNYYEVMGSAMVTWDVLNNLAKQWNAEIYQNNGRWEIVRINVHEKPDGEYQYFVYNSEGVQISRADFGETVAYPCLTLGTELFRPRDHTISMDRVLGTVGVNYLFRYKQDGDSLANLIRNGNFAYAPEPGVPPPSTSPTEFTPQQWQRRRQTPPPMPPVSYPSYMLLEAEYWPGPFPWPVSPYFPPGIDSFLKIDGWYHNRLWLTSASGYPTNVNAGDELRIRWWQRVPLQSSNPVAYFYGYSVIRINIVDEAGNLLYALVNAGISAGPDANTSAQWYAYAGDGIFPAFVSTLPQGAPNTDGLSHWGQVDIVTPPVPTNGRVVVEIVGVGASKANPTASDEPGLFPHTFPAFFPVGGGGGTALRTNWLFVRRPMWLSGIFVARIVDTSNEDVALIHPYWYTNDGAYTDSISDIEVLTGDDDNPDHVSNIYVMDDGVRTATKAWDSWSGDFGWGALGLILAKSIMNQYYRPWRVIDGDFVAPGMDWATRFEFEERPGERYKILRGTMMPSENRFSGTLVQVFDNATPELPPGGNDGGGTVDPNWQPTGVVRCVKDGNGQNTGDQEQQETDANPASQTYGQYRWVNIGENTGECPVGESILILWGADDASMDVANLEYFPYTRTGNAFEVSFDNDGSGKYLWFMHVASLGTVQSILDVEGEETLSNWMYEADRTISGEVYKVMRMNYITGVFTGHPKTFIIS